MKKATSLAIGGSFTAAVVALMGIKQCSAIEVPKTRFWPEEVIQAGVCHPLTIDEMYEAAELVPMCSFRFTRKLDCECIESAPSYTAPTGSVEIFAGSNINGEGVTGYKYLEDGFTLGACAAMPVEARGNVENIRAHELGHVCGYDHAIEAFWGLGATKHLMAETPSLQTTSTEGMSLKANEM